MALKLRRINSLWAACWLCAGLCLSIWTTSARGQSQLACYCDESTTDCVNSTCYISADATHQCETQVDVFTNGSVKTLLHLCVTERFTQCHILDPHPELDYNTYSLCCHEDDYCNQCALPDNLPPETPRHLIPLPPGCAPLPSPSTPPSHTPTHSIPSPFPTITPTTSIAEPSSTTESPTLLSSASEALEPKWQISMIVLSVVVVIGLFVCASLITFVVYKKRQKYQVASVGNLAPFEADLEEGTMSGSSGAGPTLLEERTIAKQIKKKKLMDKGRYGEVWLGEWNDEDVAIKIFSPLDEESWKREEEIYQTQMLHHENIVRFIAQDKKANVGGLELWMVMEFHHNGSLYDYLQNRTLTHHHLQRIVISIASGIQYLHLDVTAGHTQKPGIAHRDLKSRNILVKRDGSCCIADFGLAVLHNLANGMVDKVPSNPRQGTKRYMAPEVLDGSINATMFESYRMVDIYCFGLVLWEVARRCEVQGEAQEYQLPYFDSVCHDPSFEEMKKVVVVQEIRPSIEQKWKDDECLSVLSSVMKECWRTNPHARLSASRIKKKLIAQRNETKNGYVYK